MSSNEGASRASDPRRKWLPDEWDDDVRMGAMFAPFRPRSLNPEGYDGRLRFWKEAILKWCATNRKLSFTVEELREAFRRNGIRPSCIKTVVSELYLTEEMLQPKDLQNAQSTPHCVSWSGWGWNVLKASASWIYSATVGPSRVLPDVVESDKFLNMTLLDRLAKFVVEREVKEVEVNFVSKEELMKRHNLAESTLNLILGRLWSQGHLVVDDKIIKFRRSDEAQVSPITEEERTSNKLQELEVEVEKKIKDLSRDLESCQEQARVLMANGNGKPDPRRKIKAKSLLKRKHALEKKLSQQEALLSNIHQLMDNLTEAKTSGAVLEASAATSAALKEVHKNAGTETVDETLGEIGDALAEAQEIQNVIGSPVAGASSLDDAALEAELESLLAEEANQEKDELADLVSGLQIVDHALVSPGSSEATTASNEKVPMSEQAT